ncbi:S53 family peptidase [Jatrophihabitans telluris]|uniref:S53 family peptidase n=1 Tax=Jatrophihabitans telluris TaxID=2038343 RepID=A0ABY4R0T3_9ACTN|nr:S53 family peptidase [Jatrophihabitans telluris]UQX89493.1 S53 family peptidase [Jatrophihabitans telluris]
MVARAQRSKIRLIAGFGAVGITAALLAGTTSVAAQAAGTPAVVHKAVTAGQKTPAVGVHPHYRLAAHSHQDPSTLFSCQTASPAYCYGPDQIRKAYGVDALGKAGLSGAGRTIVIVDAFSSPTIEADLAAFDQHFALAAPPSFTQVAPDGLTPFDGSDLQVGWSGEITLDVEWAHAIAPKAKIVLVLAKTSNDPDILSATKYAVDHNLGDVISQSFGEAEQCVDPAIESAQHTLFQKATRMGITLLASSGDQGAAQAVCDPNSTAYFKAASSPATDPNVTAVGGTLLNADGVTGKYISETTWNEPSYQAGGGGGFSTIYGTPHYQKSLHLKSRGVPDISYNAGIDTGVLVYWGVLGGDNAGFYIFGGTSAGSPQWAGLVALADQLNHCRLGAINDSLYKLALFKSVYRNEYHDITTGTNTFYGDQTIPGYSAGPGWDPATGLGTPKANVLVPSLAAIG